MAPKSAVVENFRFRRRNFVAFASADAPSDYCYCCRCCLGDGGCLGYRSRGCWVNFQTWTSFRCSNCGRLVDCWRDPSALRTWENDHWQTDLEHYRYRMWMSVWSQLGEIQIWLKLQSRLSGVSKAEIQKNLSRLWRDLSGFGTHSTDVCFSRPLFAVAVKHTYATVPKISLTTKSSHWCGCGYETASLEIICFSYYKRFHWRTFGSLGNRWGRPLANIVEITRSHNQKITRTATYVIGSVWHRWHSLSRRRRTPIFLLNLRTWTGRIQRMITPSWRWRARVELSVRWWRQRQGRWRSSYWIERVLLLVRLKSTKN